MLVVLSDLHFEEESSRHIVDDEKHPSLIFRRNLPATPYRLLIAQLAEEAKRNGAQRLDLVLAGDVFDLHRTALWFSNNPNNERPYASLNEMSSNLEQKTLDIINKIAAETHVSEVLQFFRRLVSGKYIDSTDQEKSFPVPVELHYVLGNHDRLANATPAIRQTIRQHLGLSEHGALFPNVMSFESEQALIRHGHEYDYTNFSVDHRDTQEFPIHLPSDQYQNPSLGDWVTIDVATRLPHLFRQYHGDETILADQTLRTLYLRLLEFDDLRPITAIFNYFLYAEGHNTNRHDAWNAIEPVVIMLLEELHDDSYLLAWLEKLDKRWCLDLVDAIQAVLAAKPWRWTNSHIPFDLAESISKMALAGTLERPGAQTFAVRESSIRNGQHRFLVAGHTHKPQVSLIANDQFGDRYYVDTGTWRNRVPATPDFRQFGQLKALSYVTIYGPNEDRGALPADRTKIASFDFWMGTTQGWERDHLGIKPLSKSR